MADTNWHRPQTSHRSSICSDEALILKTSAILSFHHAGLQKINSVFKGTRQDTMYSSVFNELQIRCKVVFCNFAL